MRRGRLRRSGLIPLLILVVGTFGALAGVLIEGWGPKLGLDLEGGFSVVLQPIEEASSENLDQAIEVLRSRVDALGVAEPEITRQGETIEVSLPGVTDRDRARDLVGQTAELRFRPVLVQIPGDITAGPDGETDGADTTTTTVEGGEATTTTVEGDAGDVEGESSMPAVPFQDDTTTTTAPEATTTTTTPEPTPGPEVTPREEDDPEATVILQEVVDDAVVATYQLGPAGAMGEIIQTASARLDDRNPGLWAVDLEIRGGDAIGAFNAMAAECFSRTETCPTGQLAIVLDSEVVSAPAIQQPSFQRDQIQITGSFTEREAKDLALVLRYGALPVALEIQQTREVSATLGNDSLRAGIISGLIGVAVITLYMVAYYRLLGLVAIASLAMSGAMLWVVVCWLGETQGLALTLAGITGIIVSIGIAVDSNVVFYENLKESVGRGRSVRGAVSASFASAFSTIVKADVASLIGAGVLYVLTVGPVRGFALFLGLSTLLDLVASYFFMRPLVVRLARSPSLNEHPRRLGLPDAVAVAP